MLRVPLKTNQEFQPAQEGFIIEWSPTRFPPDGHWNGPRRKTSGSGHILTGIDKSQ